MDTRVAPRETAPFGPQGVGATAPVYLPASSPLLKVSRGQFTFDVEGREGPAYFSRVLQRPTGPASGVTIGRGYDLGHRERPTILTDLKRAGVPEWQAALLSGAALLKGSRAADFWQRHRNLPPISAESQRTLFETTYRSYEAEAKRIATKADVTEKYGATDWDGLHPAIREIVVDLLYRGDYRPDTRLHIQRSIASNDLGGLLAALLDRDLWRAGEPRGVPLDRFTKRIQFVKAAIDAHGA